MFKRVDANIDLPSVESEISAYWDKINAFETSVENRKNDKTFRFYDGPPFPTGSPHYGNLLAGVIKDIVPRYWTMRGYYVERRFGWDVHGLPIEMEVQKKLNLEDPQQIDEYGIDKFNEACRSQVQTNTELVDGLILKTITKLWILNLWKVFGGYLRNCGLKI